MERILKYATLIYALLLFVGYFSLHVYYRGFGIDIWNYLDVGETLLSFMRFSDLVFAGIVCMTVQFVYSMYVVTPIRNRISQLQGDVNSRTFSVATLLWARLRGRDKGPLGLYLIYLSGIIGFWLFCLAMIGIFMGIMRWTDGSPSKYAANVVQVFIIILWNHLVIRWVRMGKRSIRELDPLLIVVLCLSMGSMVGYTSTKRMKQVREGVVVDYAEIITDTDTTYSDSDLVYVGKCQSAIFLYRRSTLHYVAIPMGNVKRFEVSSQRLFWR